MKFYKCPQKIDNDDGSDVVFLAGGITGCPDWQKESEEYILKTMDSLCQKIYLDKDSSGFDLHIINPRRDNFDSSDKNIQFEQINWEFKYLERANYIIFWFPSETLCPITLFELGKELGQLDNINYYKHIWIGCHPDYKKRQDVIIQTELSCEKSYKVYGIFDSLENMLDDFCGTIID